jgi:hypothetical protein
LDHSSDTPVFDREDKCSPKPRKWRKAKVDTDNQGKMPFIAFGNGCISQKMALKGIWPRLQKKFTTLSSDEKDLGKRWFV